MIAELRPIFATNTKDTYAESVFSSLICLTKQAYSAATKDLQIPGSQMISSL